MREIERFLRWAGGLVTAGLITELAVSTWFHPLAFMTFVLVACPLILTGMTVFLWGLVRELARNEREDFS